MIRVLLAEDHGLVRAGLRQLLASIDDIEVVGAATNGAEAVELARETRPDVVLMDLSMPVLDGTEATRRVVANDPDVHVVVLTSFSDQPRIMAALQAGAAGYLLKDTEPGELFAGIRAAVRGEFSMDPKAAHAMVLAHAPSGDPGPDLTSREREVLALVGEGLANKRIAAELGISEKTVKAHLTRVFASIGVSDRTQAALWAQRHGMAAQAA